VIVLDGLGGSAWPRLELGGPAAYVSAPALLRTLTVRVAEQLGAAPAAPGTLAQLVGLGLPFGYGEQASFISARRSAIRLATAPDTPSRAPDEPEGLNRQRLGELGRAAEATLQSLDGAIQLSGRSAAYVYTGGRVVRGWAIQLLFLAALLPYAVGVLELLVRAIRRGTPLAPGWRRLRRRLVAAAALGAVLFVAAAFGALPSGGLEPPPAGHASGEAWLAIAAAAVAAVMIGLWVRAPSGGNTGGGRDDALGAYTVALLALGAVAITAAASSAFALLFVLPSLYTWLWLPLLERRAGWLADLVFGLGLAGPVVAAVVLAEQLGIGLSAIPYAVGLATSGTVSWVLSVCALAWIAVAAQMAATVAGAQSSAR
jgi:hypothetical protein